MLHPNTNEWELYYTILPYYIAIVMRHIATRSTIDPSSQTNLNAKLLRTILDHQILRTSKVGHTLQEFQGHGQWHHLSGCGHTEASNPTCLVVSNLESNPST